MEKFTQDSFPILLPKASVKKGHTCSLGLSGFLQKVHAVCNVFFKLSLRLITSTFFLQETKSTCESSTPLNIQLQDFISLVLQLHFLTLNCK